LRFAGYEVFAAANGEEVVEMTPKIMPDLLLLDVRMPRMTGYEACKVIKATPNLKNIPVVFLSAKGQESEIQQGLDAGAEEYLLKPFSPDWLTAQIKSVLRNKKLGVYDEDTHNEDKSADELDDVKYLVQTLRKQIKRTKKTSEQLSNTKDYLGSVLSRLDEIKSMLTSGEFKTIEEVLHQINETDVQSKIITQYPLAEISRITDGIVHDMRNGIGIIRNTVGFMGDDLSGTPHEKDILKISQSLDFCELVLRNLSALGGRDILQPEWIDLEKLIRNICFMLERKLVDVKLVIRVAHNTSTNIFADKGHMKQIFMNLIKNAGEAMPDGGTLTCSFHQESEFMRIEITDTGSGITQENQDRLFRQLFTTKERGYGLGLFIVSTIVERYGGKISVKSSEGWGTTFTLQLPIEGKK
jgi:signal transduction histidine kinase